MDFQKHLRKVVSSFSPELSLVSAQEFARKPLVMITALLTLAAFASATAWPDAWPKVSKDAWPTFKDDLRQHVADRAQVDLFDDFRDGLDAWQRDDKPTAGAWAYDQSGFVHPGALSLFRQTRGLTDYDVDALVQIQAKGVGLVFRAASLHSFQVARLIVEGSRTTPTLAVARYAVVAGRPSRAICTRYPERFQADTLYRVHLEVRGDAFSLYIQGHLVDYWTDTELPVGGVGLFSSPGEKARVAWIRVSHNTDSVGKMCAFLSSVL